MLINNCIEELTGLKDLIVKEVKNISGELHIYGRMEKRIHNCPHCGTATSKVHDYREQTIRDISSFGNTSYIHLSKRRHVCPLCGKRFFEHVEFLPRYHRMTNRLYASLLNEFSKMQPIKAVAERSNVSSTSAARIFDKAIKDSGVTKIRLHDLRHSHATWLINNGVNIVAVSKRLGHNSINETLKTYTHLLECSDQNMMNKINEFRAEF